MISIIEGNNVVWQQQQSPDEVALAYSAHVQTEHVIEQNSLLRVLTLYS